MTNIELVNEKCPKCGNDELVEMKLVTNRLHRGRSYYALVAVKECLVCSYESEEEEIEELED